MRCARRPGELHYYHTDTNICRFVKSTWNWCTYCDAAFPFFLFSSWTLCQKKKKYLSWFPQSLSDTDSCLNYKGSTESNEPTKISSYRVTPAAPLTLTSAFEPLQMSFSFTIPKSEWVMFAGTEVLRRTALHANVVSHPSSPTNQPFCSKLICIQYSGILPICTAWKYTFHSGPRLTLVKSIWNSV